MKRGLVRSSRYSPGNMDRTSLETLFVGRDDVLEDVVDRIESSIQNTEKHYLLLVGPRGSGKTHLVALAYHRIRDYLSTADTSCDAHIALLNEEEWGVASYLDFLVRILRALADRAPEINTSISRIYESFAHGTSEAELLAETTLREFIGNSTLVLICENLVDLFEGLGEVGQKRWRAFIQESGFWTILATTPALFASITLQKNPFFGFFTIRELKKLDFDTALELLIKKAIHDDQDELEEFLRTPIGCARVRAIHHLAGGNHRAYVVLFDFLDKQSLDDLIDPFMQMVDDLTPYYQDQMRQLAPAQRKIVEHLCHASRPLQIKEISASCLMTHQTASKQIGELEIAGFVSKVRIGRNTFCELTEPLMRICIEVKDNRTEHFTLFVEFLRHWFSSRELQRRVSRLEHDSHVGNILDQAHLREAIRCSLTESDEPFISALDAEAYRCLDAKKYHELATIQETLARDRGKEHDHTALLLALVESEEYQSAITAGRRAAKAYPESGTIHYFLAQAHYYEDENARALSSIDEAIRINPDNGAYHCLRASINMDLEQYEEAIADAEAGLRIDEGHWHGYGQILQSLVELGRIDEARERARDLEKLAHNDASALLISSQFYYSQDDYERALKLVDRALEFEPDNITAHAGRGYNHFSIENYSVAAQELEIVINGWPDDVTAHCRLSDSLLEVGDHRRAVDVARKLLELDPDHLHAYLVLGMALLELGEKEHAIEELEYLLDKEDHSSLLHAASILESADEYALAQQFATQASKLQPKDPWARTQLARIHLKKREFHLGLANARKAEDIGSTRLATRLLISQGLAATESLRVALDELDGEYTGSDRVFKSEESLESIGLAIAISLRQFGPRHLSRGIEKLRIMASDVVDEGVVGRILTTVLTNNIGEISGSTDEWEKSLQELRELLKDDPTSEIPLNMLTAAAMYKQTKDKQHLIALPVEQRQLLEEAGLQV